MPAAIAEAVPALPSTEGGGAGPMMAPQQTTFPVPAWMAQLRFWPSAIATAVPPVPFTERGGACRMSLWPRQRLAPVPAWIAQLCEPPIAIAVAVPAVPSTEGGGVACASEPLHTTASVPVWIAQR